MSLIDKYLIKEYKDRFWLIADIFKNGTKICTVNKFYDVSKDWIIIYDTVGGTGTGFSKGEILNKIFIGNSELQREYV